MFLQFVVVLSVIALFYPASEARTSPELKVQLEHGGVLVGRHLISQGGRDFRGFLGIPYAKPPIGERRFKAPEPFESWSGERLAFHDGPICTQRDPYRRDMNIDGSEDCLYLNVYTPANAKPDTALPVMVWFHGGGWMCGSGTSLFYGPDYLLDHDIVLVSANFRLGPLGFLSTETLDCPGNFGLKDQLEVLRWVQRHISGFGGNPNSVTLFGESAGGASVTYMMHSEKAKGLFHRGIAESGSYFNSWAQPSYKGHAAKRVQQTAKMLNCSSDERTNENKPNWSNILDCLRAQPADAVVATIYDLFEWDTDPMIPFPPVVEPAHDGAFITELTRTQPSPHGFTLPLMIGITSDEGLLRTGSLLSMPEYLAEFKENFERLLPIVLYYDHHPVDVQQQITAEIKEFYLKNGHDYSKTNYQNITDLISDGWFNSGIDEYLRLRLQHHKEHATAQAQQPPTYVYLFEQKGAASFTEIFNGGREDYYGACHGEELQYLFPIGNVLFPNAMPRPNDLLLREAMPRMWVNFAKSSNPTPANTNLPKWQPAVEYPLNFARLGGKWESNWTVLTNDYALYQDRMDFWHQLQPFVPAVGAGSDKDEL